MKSCQYGIATAILTTVLGVSAASAQIVEKPVAPIKTEGGLIAGKFWLPASKPGSVFRL